MRLFLATLAMFFTIANTAVAQDTSALTTSLLLQTARTGNLDALTDLLSNGAELNGVEARTERTPLHEAVINNHLGIAEILVANNFDLLNKVDAEGYTPVHLAVEYRHFNMLTLLVNRSADVNVTLPGNQQTPLHIALRKNYIPITRFLLENGAASIPDENGLTPLHYAVAGGYIDIAEELIEQGASVNSIDNIGNTALHYAALSGQIDMVSFLLQKDAISNGINNAGQSPATLAEGNGFPRVLTVLRVYEEDQRLKKIVFRSDVDSDYSGWQGLLPARRADAANQEALSQIQEMVEETAERYLTLVDVQIPELLELPILPTALDVSQETFESDYEFSFRAVREIGKARAEFYRIQRSFEQVVDTRNARIASLRERVGLRRQHLQQVLPLFKRDAVYEVLRGFSLEDPEFDARSGNVSFLLSATGATFSQRVAIRPLDKSIVEELYNSPEIATLSVTIIIEENQIILDEAFIGYDDENIYKAQILRVDDVGNPLDPGRDLVVNSSEIGNLVEESLALDAVFRQQETNIVQDSIVANVLYSNNRGVPINYQDDVVNVLETFVDNDFGAELKLNDSDIFDNNVDPLDDPNNDIFAILSANTARSQATN